MTASSAEEVGLALKQMIILSTLTGENRWRRAITRSFGKYSTRRFSLSTLCLGLVFSSLVTGMAAPVPVVTSSSSEKLDRFIGVYQLVPYDQPILGLPKASGTLDDLPLTSKAAEQAKAADLRWDPAKNCRVVGPFRMMAMPENRIELLPTLRGGLFMLFKNPNVGNRREIEFRDKHSESPPQTFEGESIAHWKTDDLVVDTVGFNDKTWLNGHGAPHDAKLHMTETYRVLPGSQYLQLTVTIDDVAVLTRPYTYTRYYQRQAAALGDYFCQEEGNQN